MTFVVLLIHIFVSFLLYSSSESYIYPVDYLCTWWLGLFFSAIELSSRYKDDPVSALSSKPGLLYLLINGLICVSALYLIQVFGLGFEVEESLPLLSQRVSDILQASLSSFFLMRSSFLKLGEKSQIDLGLNAVLKKMLDIVDREVDRVRGAKRTTEISLLSKGVRVELTEHIFSLCTHAMQNVSSDEIKHIQLDIDELKAADEDTCVNKLKSLQLRIFLKLYTVIGLSTLKAAVKEIDSLMPSDLKGPLEGREDVIKDAFQFISSHLDD
ncbi:hypothetical protein NO991_11865 [Pseudoalteromonas sp. DY56-GL22]|uniref:hypothetical protein n=1 Tax=Pseudoalteromonas sp. DY56-GL22 TaxID=2967126 RepID=UPI00352BAAC7